MATKYILDQIKVEGVLCDLIGKSNGENVSVTYGGTEMTLAAALAKILTDVSALPTDADVTAAVTALKQEMLGDTPVEAYNTFTELAGYIETHQDAADALTAAIGTKASQSDLTALQNTVNALGTLASKSTVSESDLDSALKEKVNAASEGNHSHGNKALLDSYTQTEADLASAVTQKHSHSNKALLDTYTQTEANLASAVTQKHTHANKATLDGVTDAKVAAWDGVRGVRYGTAVPSDMKDGELFIKVVTQ